MSEETGEAAEPSGEQEAPQEQPAQTAEQGEQSGEQEQGEPKQFDEKYVAKLREEAAKHRNDKKTTEQELSQYKGKLDQLRKALDPDASQEEDPAKVAERATQERDEKDKELRELRIERASEKAARKHGADSDALTDSKSFAKQASELDPTAEDFAEQMDALVKSTVDANPKLRAAQATPRSGSEFTGGTGGQSSNKPRSGDTNAWRKYLRGDT